MRYYISTCLAGLCHYSRCPDGDSNRAPPEYQSRALPLRQFSMTAVSDMGQLLIRSGLILSRFLGQCGLYFSIDSEACYFALPHVESNWFYIYDIYPTCSAFNSFNITSFLSCPSKCIRYYSILTATILVSCFAFTVHHPLQYQSVHTRPVS